MNKIRLNIIKILFVVFLPSLFILKAFFIQIWKHRDFMSYVNKQVITKLNINIPRGDILDRNYKILATSVEYASIYIYSKEFIEKENLKSILEKLSAVTGVSESEIIDLCNKKKYFCLKKEIPLEKAVEIKNIPGVEIVSYDKRIYPYSRLNYVIGQLNNEGIPYSGVEKEFNHILSSIGRKQIIVYKGAKKEKDTIRLTRLNDIKSLVEREKNYSIVLSIDVKLQNNIDLILKKYYERLSPKALYCIIQNPNTAEILTMNILPETKFPYENPLVSKTYEPGSVFKVFPLCIFLEEKVVFPDTTFNCENGIFEFKTIKIRDVKPHKFLSVEDILVFSSNIGMSKMFLKYSNAKKFFENLNLFGFNVLTGIELPSEVRGYVPQLGDRRFSEITPLMVSFGQGISCTPLQIVNGYSAIANGGELLQPFIVKKILDKNGNIVYEAEKRVVRRVITQETASIVKRILYETVKRGSAKATFLPNIKICAKTGTAQKFDFSIGKYSPTKYFMSCCGFFPMENPEYVVGVFVDEPKKGSLASEVAVPIFKEIVLEILNNYHNSLLYAKKN